MTKHYTNMPFATIGSTTYHGHCFRCGSPIAERQLCVEAGTFIACQPCKDYYEALSAQGVDATATNAATWRTPKPPHVTPKGQ